MCKTRITLALGLVLSACAAHSRSIDVVGGPTVSVSVPSNIISSTAAPLATSPLATSGLDGASSVGPDTDVAPGASSGSFEPSTPPSTVPATTVTIRFPDASTDVEATVLYTTSPGAALDQLGFGGCVGCVGNPLAPLVTSDRRILIADPSNARWITITAGQPTATPFPANSSVLSTVLGPGDIVYAIQRSLQTGQAQLIAYAASDFSHPLATHAITANDDDRPRIEDGHVIAGGETFALVASSAGQWRTRFDAYTTPSSPSITATYPDGSTVRWLGQGSAPVAVADGRIVFIGATTIGRDSGNVAGAPAVFVLRPDGHVAASMLTRWIPSPGGISADNAALYVYANTQDGHIQVLQYSLPK